MSTIETLSPIEVSQKYLKSPASIGEINVHFNLFEIQEILPLLSLPNVPFKNTSHGLIYLTQGKIDMLLNQEAYTFSKGTVLLAPAGQMNGFIQISPSAQGFLGTFTDSFLFGSSQQPGIHLLEEMLSPEQTPHFVLDAARTAFLNPIFQRLYQLSAPPQASTILLKQQYLLTILLELQLLYTQTTPQKKSKSDKLVLQFKKLLLSNIQNNPSPKHLAAQLHVSTNHLNKTLKQKTLLTTSQWINRQRIAEAKYLLHYSNSSIAEIAYQLGFSEPSHFSKFFKKHTGHLPSNYAK